MFRLTREVRFAINDVSDSVPQGKPTNSYAGFPSLRSLGRYHTLRVTLSGHLDPQTQYVRNIKDIDDMARRKGIPVVGLAQSDERVVPVLFQELRNAWPGCTLESLTLTLSPLTTLTQLRQEFPMTVRLSQKFEFSASHRLHSDSLNEKENIEAFGKCNNPHGHGHNYELQVTLAGHPSATGLLAHIPAFERVVAETVIDRFDHRNLNVEVAEFRELVPTVENIAMVIYRLLKPKLQSDTAKLASVTVWETAKTWCEYSE